MCGLDNVCAGGHACRYEIIVVCLLCIFVWVLCGCSSVEMGVNRYVNWEKLWAYLCDCIVMDLLASNGRIFWTCTDNEVPLDVFLRFTDVEKRFLNILSIDLIGFNYLILIIL